MAGIVKYWGNAVKGDGKLYMGRGIFQNTGRANYKELAVPLPKDPEPIEVEYLIKVGNKEVAANLQPPQSELQEAFRMSGARIVIDMVVAADIAKEMIRTARKEAFAITDNEYMKALQKEEETQEIIAKAEMLRNAPADTRITNAKNADELLTAVENIVKEFPNA